MSAEPSSESGTTPRRKEKEQSWESWIEELIRDAQARGEFDNLPGKGKPLPSRRNPFLPEDRQMAYDLVQNSGYTLPWIDEGKEIDRRIARAREKLQRDYRWYRSRQARASTVELIEIEGIWLRYRQAFAHEVDAINRVIDTYNLKVPALQFQKPRLILAEELARVEEMNP
ncbi:MAG: DUF1992 domain-containing protein [Caldilineae bacterium]|nr:MAG: DUF1992 domain-containing protein [Caldilineae bacterium]